MGILRSYKLFRLFGVDVKLHWSWLLLLIFNLVADDYVLYKLISLFILFTSVLIHEFGHVLMAKKYGIGTSSINLNILGGAALIDESYEDLIKVRKLFVVLAGPMTNLVLFILSSIIVIPFLYSGSELKLFELDLFTYIMVITWFANLIMFLFNLLPIYPMDGGRILRLILQMIKFKYAIITSIILSLVTSISVIILMLHLDSYVGVFIGIIFTFTSVVELIKLNKGHELQ